MRFDIITLFPELFTPLMQTGIIRRAFEVRAHAIEASASGNLAPIEKSGQGSSRAIDVHFTNPRDFADGNYRRIDDRPFGGGPGMLMMAEPLARCVESIQAERASLSMPACPVILFSPIGQPLVHAMVERFSKADNNPGAILICGRYEGLDQRFIDTFVTEQISLGDFVLSGGEIPAMALLDAVARLQSGVLGDDQSHIQDSFNPAAGGLLDHPHYTRPEIWRGQSVPTVLIGGNHAEIDKWREAQRKTITQANRPDMLKP